MRLHRLIDRPAPTRAPHPRQPAQGSLPEGGTEEPMVGSPPAVGRLSWDPGRRRKPAAALITAVLLCVGIWAGRDAGWLRMGWAWDAVSAADTEATTGGAATDGAAADKAAAPKAAADRAAARMAATDRATADRAAADRAAAQRLAAAQAADDRAAEERAAKADAAIAEQARKRIVAMPALVGRKLDAAMDLAADAGLTAVTVCRTPDGDTPIWWSHWRVTGQAVPPGTRVGHDQQICLSAAKP
jgi:hypothetical protein